MTRTMYRRDSVFMRTISTVVAFTFVLSIAGTGLAVPAAPELTTTDASSGEAVQGVEQIPAAEQVSAEEPAQQPAADPSVEAQPTTTEPAPRTAPRRFTDRAAARVSREAADGAAASTGMALAAVQAPYADFTDVDWEAYRISPAAQVGWAKSNLGLYREGDWIPVRIIVDNKAGSTGDVRLPGFQITFDHYDSNKNAVGVDRARNFMFYTGTSLPSGPTPPGGSSALSGVTHANGGTQPYYNIDYSPAGDVVIPKGSYGIVYFEVHLALSPYWQQQFNKFGAREYPGSSAQGRFITWNGSGTGQKTISVPVGPGTIPVGRIDGLKFNDLDENGARDTGEPGLGGFVFDLQYLGDFPFSTTATSAADGTFSFTQLPAGDYRITERAKAPWISSTPNPLNVTLARDEVKSVRFGNYLPDMTKTWKLSIDALPRGAEPYVTYKLNGIPTTTYLTGTPPSASVDAEVGSTITNIEWFVKWMGADISLGTQADEVLDKDLDNVKTYDSSVAGVKFHDLNGDGIRGIGEPGLSGWTIVLKRVVGSVETTYGQTVTGIGGAYSFADVLPGTYKVYEQNQPGWYNTVAPTGGFSVGNGSTVTGKDFGNLEVLSAIDLEKSGPAKAHVGDTITYSIVVTNTGNYLLTNILVTDPMLGVNQTIPSLAPGASTTINADHVVTASDPDPLPNTALALGVDVLGSPVSDSDDHSVDIIKPALEVVKTAVPEMATNPASVTYTYVITNIGDDPLSSVSLSDDKISVPGSAIGELAVGASATLSATTILTATTTNVATVTGEDSLGGPVSDTDSATVEVFNPAITIVKSADPVVIVPGALVAYAYLVTNTGDIALHDVAVDDDKLGFVDTIGMLGAGQSATVYAYANPMEDVTNIGTVTGYYGTAETDFYGMVTAWSSATVDVVNPGVEVVKTAAPSPVVAGTTVTYSYLVRNTGDVALVDLVVTDDVLGSIGTIASLPVGEETVLTATSVLTADTYNVATVTGADVYRHPVTDTDDETVEVFNPSIEIDKSVSDTTVLAGQVVTYSFLVTNTGDIDLFDIEVTDDKLGTIGTIASLAAGSSATLTMDSAISADVTNIGTATGYYGEPESDFFGSVTDTDSAAVDVIAPAVEVVKSASPSMAVAGTEITYSYLVRNTGDVTLFGILVVDDKLGEIGTVAELEAGDEVTLTATATLTETTENTVVVTGYDADENPVTDDDTLVVPIYNPSISIAKSASAAVVLPGEVVTYTYLVTNTGDVPLTDVVVSDDIIGYITTIPLLGVGASVPVTAPQALMADTVNVGTATGTYGAQGTDFHGTVTANDSASVDVVDPAIDVQKFGAPSPALQGAPVTYTYIVTNTGDVPLVNVQLVDDKLGVVGTVALLPPGESRTFSVTETLTETTTNVVTASAADEFGHPVSDTASVTVDVFAPAIEVVKTASDDVILSGTTVTYTYTITNTGNAPLSNVTLVDDKLGAITLGVTSLAPGASTTVTMASPIASDTINIATASGTYGEVESQFFGTVTDTDDASVDVVAPALAVVKTAAPTAILAGETVVYTYVVTNTGDVPLNGVTLTDDKLGAIGSAATLAVGANAQFTASTTLSVPTTNVVEAVGTDDFGHTVRATDDAFVDVAAPFTPPNLVIDKRADRETARPGDTVRYTVTYRNIGPSPASEMVITDDYDERYVTVTDAAGGVVAGGKITWNVAGPLTEQDGPQSITYTVRIDADLPASVERVRNTVVIFEPTEEDTDDNTDSWTVDVGRPGEPFLPFTGGAWVTLLAAAALATGAGVSLRRRGARARS